jgi:membrane fusion protein, copper/silver efflux system
VSRHRPIAIALTLLALGALGGGGCESSPPSRAAIESTPSIPRLIRQANGAELLELMPGQVPGMTITTVKQVELPGILETSGQVTFDDRRVATIVSRVNGRIEATRVSQWDNVARGEPIVELYSPDFMTAEAEYLQALATSKLSLAPGIGETQGLAGELVLAAKRKLELLGMEDADIRALRAPNPTVWMRAPISGTALEKKALRGAQISPGDILYTLGTLNDVWITADIYEADLARVHGGQQLEAVATAFPDEVFKGVISRISPNIDPATHTLQIRCEVRNPGLKLKPQMLARVKIVTGSGSAVVVPQESLVFETDAYYAFVDIGDNRIERRKVVIGPWNRQGYVRVISGLEAGERVVDHESIQVDALWHQATGTS